ncbi:hypothetical protein PP939_gp095 [Rhizobium phage RL38J1]|uniref:Uncharacterized protein n=1 Tax=Rhizobium phage RL38J1 TaxID=2663232 RepID=A0A6B9J767_9CAUD|nr:hypothetical protein PP939_gp095 [Rhizobium phage RL38J1]QGZ14101.1 hypothetical protein RL38J1_095 [Rhizobium phage RL38J1]
MLNLELAKYHYEAATRRLKAIQDLRRDRIEKLRHAL